MFGISISPTMVKAGTLMSFRRVIAAGSRAAARAMVDSKKGKEKVIQIVFVSPMCEEEGPIYKIPKV